VLKGQHPDARMPEASTLEDYDTTLNFVELNITEEVIEKVAR
jgi:hypothetical protein